MWLRGGQEFRRTDSEHSQIDSWSCTLARFFSRARGSGHGTTFTIQLAAPSGDQALAGLQNEELAVRAPVADPSRRVHVVDDNRDAAASLATLLRLNGHQVMVEHDGQKGLDRADS